MYNNYNAYGNMNYQNNYNINTNQYDPYNGFIRGNLFDNLYEPYKNYKPGEVNPTNEKDYAMTMIQIYGFALNDLNLYLDVYPNDSNAIKLYNKYKNLYNESMAIYQNNYGPISLESNNLSKTPWQWLTNSWPWEVK